MNAITPPQRPMVAAGGIERVSLKIIRPGFGIAEVRLIDVNLRNLGVAKKPDGSIRVHPPRIISRNGQADYGVAFALQPFTRQAIEAALLEIWDRMEADDDAAR